MTEQSPRISRKQLLNFCSGALLGISLSKMQQSQQENRAIPAVTAAEDNSILAQDDQGNPILAEQILAASPGSRIMVVGFNDEPVYLTVKEDGNLQPWGLVNICTHMGCTFDWNEGDDQFQCPCHESHFDPEGKVVQGPAAIPLELVQVSVDGEYIRLSRWQDTDPRTNEIPWWL